jgi:ferrous iron transport protein A
MQHPNAETLDRAAVGVPMRVTHIGGNGVAPEWAERLAELGFLAGERVMVTARGPFGGDPIAVQIGLSNFALRKAEAACVQVTADGAPR